ncbi:MAG TPA: HNH endonuclease [Thermoanaerobaculia bacterium]|nr:HNH endonuclease [Thermoanaerobaculia bacterium]
MIEDTAIRLAAFDWLRHQVAVHGEVLPWSLLVRGFEHGGQRVPLVSQQGIFKPKLLNLPLSIRTAAAGPYDDSMSPEGVLLYRYRGTDRLHRENVGLRHAMEGRVPLVYFHALSEGRYLAAWPVYIVGDEPGQLSFTVAVDDSAHALQGADFEIAEPRREYVTATFRRRLHQLAFRERVLRAYRERCAMCRLRHRELLDAAHIVPDQEPEGLPSISNGLSLCKLHHTAFDNLFVTVDPDYRVVVRADVLDEKDGPMLLHGLQELHGRPIELPRRAEWMPSRDALFQHLRRFSAAS